jgi:ATP-dependent Lhr-like helicase
VTDPAGLVAADGLRAALETWLAGNAVMKRTFRSSAIIAGLIERTVPGQTARPGGRRRFRPISSMTRCANTTPTT